MEHLQPPNVAIGSRVNALSWIEFAVALPFVAARFYTRTQLIHNLGADDWTILVAMSLSLATSIINTLQVHYGLGRHIIYLGTYETTLVIKTLLISQPLSTFSSCFAKISVALLLRRLMNRHKAQEIFLYFLIASLLIVNTILNIETFARCRPAEALWNLNVHGRCSSAQVTRNLGIFQGAWSIFADFTLALFPILLLYNLQLKARVKVGIGLLMSLGLIASAAAIIRVYEVARSGTPDFTWDSVNLVYAYTTENYLVIIAACIPTLKPLYQRTSQLYSQYRGSQKKDRGQPISPLHHFRNSRNHFRDHDRYDSITELTVVDSLSTGHKPTSKNFHVAV